MYIYNISSLWETLQLCWPRHQLIIKGTNWKLIFGLCAAILAIHIPLSLICIEKEAISSSVCLKKCVVHFVWGASNIRTQILRIKCTESQSENSLSPEFYCPVNPFWLIRVLPLFDKVIALSVFPNVVYQQQNELNQLVSVRGLAARCRRMITWHVTWSRVKRGPFFSQKRDFKSKMSIHFLFQRMWDKIEGLRAKNFPL